MDYRDMDILQVELVEVVQAVMVQANTTVVEEHKAREEPVPLVMVLLGDPEVLDKVVRAHMLAKQMFQLLVEVVAIMEEQVELPEEQEAVALDTSEE